ncbi:unnamed protein product, partial [Coregonus sp. 'balchen']
MAIDWLGFGYAAAIALGGFMGYKRKVASGALTIVMGMRFKKSGKIMPGGIMAGLSLLMVLRLLFMGVIVIELYSSHLAKAQIIHLVFLASGGKKANTMIISIKSLSIHVSPKVSSCFTMRLGCSRNSFECLWYDGTGVGAETGAGWICCRGLD